LIFTYIVSIDIFVVLLSIIPLIAILFIRGHSEKLKYQLNVATTLPNRKKNYAKRMMYLPEYVKEIKLTKIYNQLKCIYKEGVLENIKQYKTVGKKIALLEFFGVLISDVLIVFIPLIYIVIRTAFGKYYLIGDIVGITQSTMYFSWDIEGIIDSFINIKSTKYYINEYLSFLDLEEENVQGCSLDGNDGLIFNNVSFKYINSEKNILKNINFKIKNGDKIAIVGENGSGKTTLISLMLNLYKRFDGEIILNGKDINCYSRDSLNKFFGVLLQNYHIYPFSIRDNISMGNNVDENSINEIIKYLDLNNKLDDTSKTITKEFEDNGVILSGGQEQKLAIIRLFAQKCSFVILDEPTSSLDPFSEKQVYESMFKLFHEKTIIFISHRLSSVNFVDKIFVMNNGEIIEEGSHEKLMKDKGYYFDLYSIQARRFLEEK
jgi:ATP-binding cassette subfamily B protein